MLLGLLGFAAVACSLLMGLWMQHVRERPVYERPAILIRPAFRMIWSPARWLMFATGVAALGRASLAAAVVLLSVLAALAAWKRYLMSRHHRHHMIRAAFLKERARDPSASDVQILQRLLAALHARWGEELIEQIVLDNPTPEGVADMVVRMERGALPKAFRPSRIPQGRR
jgi:hypothetical protein